MPSSNSEAFGDDLLTGAAEIAAFRGEPLRRTNYLLERGHLPAFKEGRIWKMRKSAHQRHIEALESAALARAAGQAA